MSKLLNQKLGKMVNFKEAKRQSPVAILLILYRVMQMILRQTLPILVVLILNPKASKIDFIGIGIMAIGIISAFSSVMSYFKFFYYVDDSHFHIRKGWLVKSNISIPIERIQTIDFYQNPIHKIFNVVQLDVDTAGSASKEIHIHALKKNDANLLRNYLYSKKEELLPEEALNAVEHTEEEQILHRLGVGDLIKIGLVQNHLRTAGIIVAFGFTLYGELSEIFAKATDRFVEESFGVIERGGIYLTLTLLMLLLLASIVGSVIVFFLQNYDLKLTSSGKGYRLVKGLLNQKQTSISLSKIQMLRWSSNYLQRKLNLVNLSIYQASSIIVNVKRAIYVPGLSPVGTTNILSYVFEQINPKVFQIYRIHPLIILRRMLIMVVIPLLVIIMSNLDQMLRGVLISLVWILFSAFWSYQYYKRYKIQIHEAGILIENGVLTIKGVLMEWKNVQSIALKQTPIQKRRALTNMVLYTAAGAVQIPFVRMDEAKKLRDFILYHTEHSKKEWM